MTDPVLIEAKNIRAQKGLEPALLYLSGETSKYTVNNDLFFKYFFKFLDYAFEGGMSECGKIIEENLIQLFVVLDKNKLFNYNYQKACDYLFRFYVLKKDGNKAMQSTNRLSYILNSNPSNYLLIYKEISEKSIVANQLLNTDQQIKSTNHVYHTLMAKLLDIAWHLYVDWSTNIQAFEVNKMGIVSLDFKVFKTFNILKWEVYAESTMEDFFDDSDILIFERIIKDYDSRKILSLFDDYFFSLFPIMIDFKLDFLNLDFRDLDSFGKWFSDKHTKDDYPSYMFVQADRLANDFIEKYTV